MAFLSLEGTGGEATERGREKAAALLVHHLVLGNRKLGVVLYSGPEGKEKMN